MSWLKDKLVEDAATVRKYWSVRIATLGVSLQVAWMAMPESVKMHIPEQYAGAISTTIFVCAVLAQFVNQPSLAKPSAPSA